MSSILKLRIQGIRAFDNYTFQDIEFQNPLTLISGPNGVGKTTVIECLRYITTGDLPPNAKGGAFLHDPRMSGEKEVYAQVKLLYKNAAGQKMVVTRSMKLNINNKGSITFKTLEGQLKIYGDVNQSGSISSRCADLNTQVPVSMGVPPAILNYVIFCHQEDSLWPLSEPSIVKKRFDEIFEASKYSKALESLKTIRKDYMSNIRVEKVQVEHLEQDKVRVLEKKQLLKTLSSRISQLNVEMDELQQLRIEKSNEMDELVRHGERLQKFNYAYKDAERIQARLIEEINTLNPQLTPLQSSDDELVAELNNSNGRELEFKEQISQLTNEIQKLNLELDANRELLGEISNKRGRVEKAYEMHMERVHKLNEILEGKGIAEWSTSKREQLESLEEDIDTMEVAHRSNEELIMKSVNNLEAARLQNRRIISDSREEIRSISNEILKIESEIAENKLRGVGVDSNTDFEWIKTRLREQTVESSGALEALKKFENGGSVQTLRDALKVVEAHVDQARSNLQEVIESASAQSRLVFLRDSLSELDKKVANMEGELSKQVVSVGASPGVTSSKGTVGTAGTVDKALTLISTWKSDHEQLKLENSNLDSKIESLEANITSNNIKLENFKLEESRLKTELPDFVDVTNYEGQLHELENKIIEATEEQEQLKFANIFFQRALDAAKSENKCVLCDHHKHANELDAFVSKLTTKLQNLSMDPESVVKELKNKQSEMRKYAPQVRRLLGFVDDISESLSLINKDQMELDNFTSKMSELKLQIENSESKILDLKPMESMVSQIQRFKEERKDVTQKLETEKILCNTSDVTMTPQEAQEFLTNTETELKQARLDFESAKTEHEKLRNKHMMLEQGVQKLKLQISDLELANTKIKQAELEIEKLQVAKGKANSKLEFAQSEQPQIDQQISDESAKLRQKKSEYAKEERTFAEKRRNLVAEINLFDETNKEIMKFEDLYGKTPLQTLNKEYEEVQTKYTNIQSRIHHKNEEVTNVEKIRTDFSSYKRNLSDNLRIRKLNRQLQRAEEEKKLYVTEMTKLKSEFANYEVRVQDLQNQVGELNHEISRKSGESKILGDQIQQIRHELATSYKDCAEQYRLAVAQLQTSEGATEDIARYVKALDSAIMQYHSLKMAEINSLLDELWKSTYTGTDIDSISIRSESDVGSASTRANYNYRVCMLKQDTELDMRGRCSAGQKVLTSILIRMALAECFGSNSGVLVLDEPTTNLDRENIESLARSLGEIIESRRSQNNFQLIVITHDEHFLAQMNPSSYSSFYYKIQRDQRQHSVVKKVPIANLNE